MSVENTATARGGEEAARAPDEAPPGARLGRWLVGEDLGAGGFGRVMVGTDEQSGRAVALKVLRREFVTNTDAVARFEREARTLLALAIPGVARVYELGRTEDGRPYFAMELLRGCDLKRYLTERVRLSVQECLAIFGPLSETLTLAHAQGVIHRDIKASNVFLAQGEAAERRIVVLDFGVAKLLDEPGPGLTASRQIVGSPASMAPEQILGAPVDARTDVYALGALAFHALAGFPPFRNAPLLTLCQLNLHARVPNPSSVAPVHAAFDGVIARAMHKDPAQRYSSAAAFYAALSEAARTAEPALDRRSASVVVIAIETRAEPGALSQSDPGLFEDLERIIPVASDRLEAFGFRVALRTGNSVLGYAELEPDPIAQRRTRRRALDTALGLQQVLQARSGSDPRVSVQFTVTSGTATLRGDALVQGQVLDELFALPETQHAGVRATPNTILDLAVTIEPDTNASRLVRVIRVD